MNIFEVKGDYIYLSAQYCEFYIPMYYFDPTTRYAEDIHEGISVLGIFNVGIFDNGKLKEMKLFNLPTFVTIFAEDSETREITLPHGETLPCRVVKFIKGAKIMQSVMFENDEYAKAYLNFITSGKLPRFIPYSKMVDVWKKNQKINGVNFGLPSLYLEMVLSVICRNPKDLSQKFAKIASESGVSDYDYASASIRQICQYNSTFTALTYEDIDSMISSSLNKSREKVHENESPVERVIKY